MKSIALWIIGVFLAITAGYQTYLAGLASIAPDIAEGQGSLLVQGMLDKDIDGVDDNIDNCIGVYNPHQIDSDNDGHGDACQNNHGGDGGENLPCQENDVDKDIDGVCDSIDNCIGVYNPSQIDSDNDGHGDACDNPSECVSGDIRPCGSAVGACEPGIEKCVNGFWDGICRDDIGPVPEGTTCDWIDNDCDGSIDEGIDCNPGTDGVCGWSNGSCQSGIAIPVGNGITSACGTVSQWKCLGTDGGNDSGTCSFTNDPCDPDPINGLCGSSFGQCVYGYATNLNNTACGVDDTWTCKGEYGGSSDYCYVTDECNDPCAGRGGDSDDDGVCNENDNCPYVRNPSQVDTNGYEDFQGQGDACEEIDNCYLNGGDSDNDGICDLDDNCPYDANTNQADSDNDGIGNACEVVPPTPPKPVCYDQGGDSDRDLICDLHDNCPYDANTDQKNSYGDKRGDACEPRAQPPQLECHPGDKRSCGRAQGECSAGYEKCIDGRRSGICEGEIHARSEVCDGRDNDCDGSVDEGYVCQPEDPCEHRGHDTDRDGVCGYDDNCPNTYNPRQEDRNGYLDTDQRGDACEVLPIRKVRHTSYQENYCPDSDDDGVCNDEDHCPNTFGLVNNYGCVGVTYVYREPVVNGCSTRGGDTDGDGFCDFDDVCHTIAGTAANNGCPGTNACPYGYEDDGRGGCGGSYQYTTASHTATRRTIGYGNYNGSTTINGYPCRAGFSANGYGGCTLDSDSFRDHQGNTRTNYGGGGTTKTGYECRAGFSPNEYGGCTKDTDSYWDYR